jgi:hypothetical protein
LVILLPSVAAAEGMKVTVCHAGIVDLLSFSAHVKKLRGMTRYSKEDIDGLIAQERKGGPDFFSSQVIVQEEQSGSGTFDLRMIHGLSDAKNYINVTAWNCQREDYPIVYFVGFRVRKIVDGAIYVSRQKSIVNVISLKTIDPELDKDVKVKLLEDGKVLCDDIGKGCVAGIFYERS